MGKNIKEIEKEFINRTGKISKQWGLGESAGRVWATLLFADTTLTQTQIAKKTEYTLSLVSPSLKILEKLNIVRSVRGKGKEKLYEPSVSFVEAFTGLVKNFLEQDVKPLISQLDEITDIKNEHRKKRMNQLVKEYKSFETHLTRFHKMMKIKKVTADKIGSLLK